MNQHQTAHYIEKTGAKWEYIATDKDGNPDKGAHWVDPVSAGDSPHGYIRNGFLIRLWLDPITRLPSHLPPYRPDARDPGDGYRVPAKQDSCNQPHQMHIKKDEWCRGVQIEGIFRDYIDADYRLPASVPFPDEAEALADYVEPEVKGQAPDNWKVMMENKWKLDYEEASKTLRARITELESQLARFQWRSPSQKPTAEDMDADGYVVVVAEVRFDPFYAKEIHFDDYKVTAWMPAPKPPAESDCQRIIRKRGLTEEEVRIIREAAFQGLPEDHQEEIYAHFSIPPSPPFDAVAV